MKSFNTKKLKGSVTNDWPAVASRVDAVVEDAVSAMTADIVHLSGQDGSWFLG